MEKPRAPARICSGNGKLDWERESETGSGWIWKGRLAASSIFPALMMGIFSKRISKEGAIAGMVAGIGLTLFYVFQHKGIMFIASTAFLGDMPPNWFLGIEPNAFGVVGALLNFAVAFAVSAVTAAPPASVQELVEHIRIPAGAEAAVEH